MVGVVEKVKVLKKAVIVQQRILKENGIEAPDIPAISAVESLIVSNEGDDPDSSISDNEPFFNPERIAAMK